MLWGEEQGNTRESLYIVLKFGGGRRPGRRGTPPAEGASERRYGETERGSYRRSAGGGVRGGVGRWGKA